MSNNPDLRGLTSKGKKDYPRFSRKQIEIQHCELCTGIQNVTHYDMTRRSGSKDTIYLCDTCMLKKPDGVLLVPIPKEEPIEVIDGIKKGIKDAQEGRLYRYHDGKFLPIEEDDDDEEDQGVGDSLLL